LIIAASARWRSGAGVANMEDDPALVQSVATVFCWEEVQAGSEDGLVIGQECIQLCKRVQRCEKSVHGSHKERNNHESTGHRSF